VVELPSNEPWILIAVVVVVFAGAVFQASIGFGANVIAQPVVFLLEPSLVPGSVLFATAVLSWLVMKREPPIFESRSVGGALAGLALGVTAGAAVLQVVSDDGLALIIAVSVLVMVGLLAGDYISIAPTVRAIAAAAVAGGFAGTTSGIGGPPMALVYRNETGPKVRGSLAAYFVLSSPAALTGLAIAGRFGADELVWGLLLLPVAAAGFAASKPLLPIVDRGATKPAILAVSAAAAVILLVRTVLRL
jgi:uncharacterized membrane protein YfcA